MTALEAVVSAEDGKIGDIAYIREEGVVDKMASALREAHIIINPLRYGVLSEVGTARWQKRLDDANQNLRAALAAFDEATKS